MHSAIASELSVAMRGSTSILPLELWHVIMKYALADSMEPGDCWMVKQSITGQWHKTSLRSLSQVNHALRRVLMPFVWRFVLFAAPRWDTQDLIGLAQLIHDLSIRGPLLSASDCVRRIRFQMHSDSLHLPRTSYREPDDYSKSREAFNKLMRCRLGNGPEDEGALPLTLRKLSQVLIGCKQLKMLEWSGWLEPDPHMLLNIAQCTSLQRLSLDLGSPDHWVMRNCWQLPASVREMDKEDVFDIATNLSYTIPRVQFSVEPRVNGCPTCEEPWGALETNINPSHGTPAVKLLTACRFINTLTLGAPMLLYERWMVPLWAQLERLEFDPDYWEPYIDNTMAWTAEDPRDPDMDDDMLMAAQALPSVLDFDQRTTRLLREKPDDVDAIARAVHKAINASEHLREWRYWFPTWTDEPFDKDKGDEHAGTITIMRNVAEVLIERHKRETKKRKRYETPAPYGYLCQTEEYWRKDREMRRS